MCLMDLATSPPHKGTAPPQPDTTETYCSPSCSQVIGDPTIPEPTWNEYNTFPVASSNPRSSPSGVPVNTIPPAVASTPPHNGALFSYLQEHRKVNFSG